MKFGKEKIKQIRSDWSKNLIKKFANHAQGMIQLIILLQKIKSEILKRPIQRFLKLF